MTQRALSVIIESFIANIGLRIQHRRHHLDHPNSHRHRQVYHSEDGGHSHIIRVYNANGFSPIVSQ